MLEGLEELVDYFDQTYVSGGYRRIRVLTADDIPVIRVRRMAADFAPEVWNVHDRTLQGLDRTNNQCEGWNTCNSFQSLVGHDNPSLQTAIDCIQKDQTMTLDLIAKGRTMQQKSAPFNQGFTNATEDFAQSIS